MGKIACVSDLHGHLPEIPDCDMLLLGGDYSDNIAWYVRKMKPWLADIRARGIEIVGCAGNHDFPFQDNPRSVPSMDWTYLQDSGCERLGLKIYGSPYTRYFFGWAFNLYEPQLAEKWAEIPDDTDILVLHQPPYMHGDLVADGQEHVGSPSLLARIKEIQPKLVVCGHIHSAYGRYNIGDTVVLNSSLCNESYKPVNPIQVFEF